MRIPSIAPEVSFVWRLPTYKRVT